MAAHDQDQGGLSLSAAARVLAQLCCFVEANPLIQGAKADRQATQRLQGKKQGLAAPPFW